MVPSLHDGLREWDVLQILILAVAMEGRHSRHRVQVTIDEDDQTLHRRIEERKEQRLRDAVRYLREDTITAQSYVLSSDQHIEQFTKATEQACAHSITMSS